MNFTFAVVQLVQFGHFRIETASAKLLVASVHRPIADHVVTGYELTASLTTNLHHILPPLNGRIRTDYSSPAREAPGSAGAAVTV
jgi:hypothetical protein